ncbi:hypothetical protein WH5701_03815 [Synechococcus sp. WH 5701]|nr:hypothetical protein WH5701_03815 [Synechococcus sp. WH 5701]
MSATCRVVMDETWTRPLRLYSIFSTSILWHPSLRAGC